MRPRLGYSDSADLEDVMRLGISENVDACSRESYGLLKDTAGAGFNGWHFSFSPGDRPVCSRHDAADMTTPRRL